MSQKKYVDLKKGRSAFLETLKQCTFRLNPATSTRLLRNLSNQLKKFSANVRKVKIAANAKRDEDLANEMLGCQCFLDALSFEADMWIYLKEGEPEKAWGALVDAEENMALSKRAYDDEEAFSIFQRNYLEMEKLLFPKLKFQSAAFYHDPGKCTICDKKMADCDHIPGKIYFGQVCLEYGFKTMGAEHVALVDEPHDRKCIMVKYRAPGEDWVNIFTGETEPFDPAKEKDDQEHPMVSGIIMTFDFPPGTKL